eukprot:9585334-Ditylum_brightwellii.AAC.1
MQQGSSIGKKPQRSFSGVDRGTSKGNQTFMQKMRMEQAVDSLYKSGNKKDMGSTTVKNNTSLGGAVYCNNSLKSPLNSLAKDSMFTMSTPAGSVVTHVTNQQQRAQLLSKAPLHMKKTTPQVSSNRIKNPYAKNNATNVLPPSKFGGR